MTREKMVFLFAKNGKNEGYCLPPKQAEFGCGETANHKGRWAGTPVEAKVRFVEP